MQEFKIRSEDARDVEYLVVKCPYCERIQRFLHKQEFFGKLPKNAGCKQCQRSFPLADNSIDNDPLPVASCEEVLALRDGKWVPQGMQKGALRADFTTADRL